MTTWRETFPGFRGFSDIESDYNITKQIGQQKEYTARSSKRSFTRGIYSWTNGLKTVINCSFSPKMTWASHKKSHSNRIPHLQHSEQSWPKATDFETKQSKEGLHVRNREEMQRITFKIMFLRRYKRWADEAKEDNSWKKWIIKKVNWLSYLRQLSKWILEIYDQRCYEYVLRFCEDLWAD